MNENMLIKKNVKKIFTKKNNKKYIYIIAIQISKKIVKTIKLKRNERIFFSIRIEIDTCYVMSKSSNTLI